MSTFGLDKALYHLRQSEHAARFQQDLQAFLAAYDLTPEEARALAAADLVALDRLGANGYLLLGFAHRAGLRDYRQLTALLAGGTPPASAGD
jgi:hypothetical protein